MKKKEKTVCQIIRFRGKIEAFLVSIDEFAISTKYGPGGPRQRQAKTNQDKVRRIKQLSQPQAFQAGYP